MTKQETATAQNHAQNHSIPGNAADSGDKAQPRLVMSGDKPQRTMRQETVPRRAHGHNAMSTTSAEPGPSRRKPTKQPAPYAPAQLNPRALQDAVTLIDDYLLHDESFRNYLIDSAQRFFEAGSPIDERIGHLAHRAAVQLKHKYPHDASLANGQQMEATSQAICTRIIQDAEHLNAMVGHYWITPSVDIAQSIAPMDIMQQGERLGRTMLKDPAIRNICTHMAYRMARLSVDASGAVDFDGSAEIANYANMARTYLAKHHELSWAPFDAAIRETGRWMAQQVNERANAMIPRELATLWKEAGDIPNPLAGEYASHRFEERDWLAANLHAYNKRTGRTPQHGAEAITQQIPSIDQTPHGHGAQAANAEKSAPPSVDSQQHATAQGAHVPQSGKHGVGERLRSMIGNRANGRISDSAAAESKSVTEQRRQSRGQQRQERAPMR